MTRRDAVWMLVLVALGAAITIAWGERMGIHGGEGWDGQAYAAWARDFPREVLHGGVTAFQAQRVLPSAIVYGALSALGIATTAGHVIFAFQILDALALVGVAAAFARTAAILGWSRTTAWAAFAATFLAFATARAALYYPVETDPLALVLAAVVTWAFFARRPIVHAVALLAAACTWPALLAPGGVLLVLPRPREPLPAAAVRSPRALALAIAAGAAAFVVGEIVYALAHPVAPGGWGGAPSFLAYAHRDLEPVTIAIVAATTAAAAYFVARQERTWSIAAYLRAVGWSRLAGGVLAVAAIAGVTVLWVHRVGTQGPGFTWRDLRNYYAVNSVRAPLWSVVHQVVYLGPVVLVAIAAWPRLAAVLADWGPGAVLAAGMLVVAAVNADGRHLIHLFPLLVAATFTATDGWWTRRRALGFALLGVGWSKLWWHIGYDQVHNSRTWPDLRWFMQQGPWASDETFLWHLGGCVVSALVLVALARWGGPARER